MSNKTKTNRMEKEQPEESARTLTQTKQPDSPQAALILNALANGATGQEAATIAKCSRSTVVRTKSEYDGWLEDKRQELTTMVVEQLDAPIHARLADASNPDSRTGASSFKELRELAFPSKGVHIGDNVQTNIQVNVEAPTAYDAGEHEALMREIAGARVVPASHEDGTNDDDGDD